MHTPRLIAVILSTWRPGTVVEEAVTAALGDRAVDEVHVWGYDPTGRAHVYDLLPTLYHEALDHHINDITVDVLDTQGKKTAYRDTRERLRWRASIALDMWTVMSKARALFPRDTILYLENDAVLKPGRIGVSHALLLRSNAPAASCYRVGGARVYDGDGNLCYLLTPRADPGPHLLSYHFVQPADWIMSDYSRGGWPAYDCVTHGTPGKQHVSSREI